MIRPGVKTERTGWRDSGMSERHRHWGFNCPAVDIDFLLIEYETSEPIALIEYKRSNAPPVYANSPSIAAIIKLADRAKLPTFVVRYATDYSRWRVVPLNDEARKWMGKPTEMGEPEYVQFLYHLRGRSMPPDLFSDVERF